MPGEKVTLSGLTIITAATNQAGAALIVLPQLFQSPEQASSDAAKLRDLQEADVLERLAKLRERMEALKALAISSKRCGHDLARN